MKETIKLLMKDLSDVRESIRGISKINDHSVKTLESMSDLLDMLVERVAALESNQKNS